MDGLDLFSTLLLLLIENPKASIIWIMHIIIEPVPTDAHAPTRCPRSCLPQLNPCAPRSSPLILRRLLPSLFLLRRLLPPTTEPVCLHPAIPVSTRARPPRLIPREELCDGPFVDDGEGEEFCGAPFDDDVVGFCVSGFSFPDGSDLSDTLEGRKSHDDPLPQTLARSFDSDGDLGIILPQLMSALNLSEDTEEEEEQAAGLDGGGEGFMLSGFDLEPPPVTDDFLGGLQIVMDTDEGREEEAARGDRSGVGLMPSGFDHGPPPIMRGFVGGFRMLVGADHTDSDSDDADFVEVLAGQVGEAESRVRPLPASRAAVDGLPEATLSEEEASQGCAVCKDSFQPGQRVIRLPCKHYFHGDCIQPWLAIRNTCPVCRYELPTDDAGSGQRHARHVTALVPVVHENASAQVHCPVDARMDSMSVTNRKEFEQPSPVSVLEPPAEDFFCGENIKLDRTYPHDPQLRLKPVKFPCMETVAEVVGISGISDYLCSEIEAGQNDEAIQLVEDILEEFGDEEERDFSYLLDILIASGIHGTEEDQLYKVCQSLDCPASYDVFEELEKKYMKVSQWSRSDRKLIFDMVNSILSEILAPCLDMHPWVNTARNSVPMWGPEGLLEKVLQMLAQRREELALSKRKPEKKAFDQKWPDLADCIDKAGRDVEKMIKDDLLEELLLELMSR